MASGRCMSTSTTEIENSEEYHSSAVKIPRNGQEYHPLKDDHFEDDNADITFINFPLYAPNICFSVLSGCLFTAAVVISLSTDYIPSAIELRNGFIKKYGTSRYYCQANHPFPKDGLPSILNLFEVNVVGNVLFRLAVGLPMALRIFNAFTLRTSLRIQYEGSSNTLFTIFNELLTPVMFIEVVSLAYKFSIITTHSDFKGLREWNRVFKMVFAVSSTMNMLLTTTVFFSYSRKSDKKLDTVSIGVKVLTAAIYCCLAPKYFHNYHATAAFPICHSYVSQAYALMEYAILVSYAAFHSTSLLDIRDAYCRSSPSSPLSVTIFRHHLSIATPVL